MATSTEPRMPAEFSDDLLAALYRETSRGVPSDQRSTCPVHLDWDAHCRGWHVKDCR
ncbi:hypothetical protein ACWERY_02205 [Streptomyces sp. NPDC004082]